MKRKLDWKERFIIFAYASLVLSLIFLTIRWYFSPNTVSGSLIEIRTKADYTLMITQCLLGIVAMRLPEIFERRWHLNFPSTMIFLYVLFLYCAIYLGEVRSFYYIVPNWDTVLHTFSGGMIAVIGFSVISLLNNSDKIPVNLSPIFVAVFAFCFALTMGVIWEIYEFTFDGVLSLNMQKFRLEGGAELSGRSALMDTMKDLIVDAVGAFVTSSVGYFSLKYDKDWLDKMFIKRTKKKKEVDL